MSHRNDERRKQQALALANRTLPDEREANDPRVARAVYILRQAALRKRKDTEEGPSRGELKRQRRHDEDHAWAEWRKGRGLE